MLKEKSEHLGRLFIVAAPSGAGKTSLVRGVIASLDNLLVSISCTTRAARPGEVEGVDYFFLDETRFKAMIEQNAFLEYASVFGYFYGTPAASVKMQLEAGKDVILEIDWQGAEQIKKLFNNAVRSIFIVPPTLACLKERLKARGQDSDEIIQKRMLAAKTEISHFHEFDYLIVNEDFEKSVTELKAIILATRLSIGYQAQAKISLIKELMLSSPEET